MQKSLYIKSKLIWVCNALLILFVLGCTPDDYGIQHIIPPDQSHTKYGPQTSFKNQEKAYQNFRINFLYPWKAPQPSAKRSEIQEEFSFFESRLGYSENRKKREITWLNHLLDNADLDSYPNIRKPAITITSTTLRHLPTHKPLFKEDTHEEVFFDRLQKTTLYANTPIHVNHRSKDKAWLYVSSCYANGWISAKDIAFVSPAQMSFFSESKWVAIIQDDVPLISTSAYRTVGRIGMLLPKINAQKNGTNAIVFDRDSDYQAVAIPVFLSDTQAADQPVSFNSATVQQLAKALTGQAYGWGGAYENRDCSALLKDFMVPFGIFLPRHSADQAKKTGSFISFNELNLKEKEEKILNEGIAYQTLLWFPGHIMLYIGSYQKKPYVFHAIWKLQNSKMMIGQSVISTLELKDDQNLSLLNRVKGMTILNQFP